MKKTLVLAAALLLSSSAMAQLTLTQMTTLKAACNAVQTCAALAATADDVALAAWFNTADPGACIVWRSDVRTE